MPVQRIHPCKILAAPFARERPIVGMQLFMSLAVMLPCKAFATARPLALERLFLIMRTHVSYENPPSTSITKPQGVRHTLEIEAPRERAATSRNGTHKIRVLFSPYAARVRRSPSRYIRLRHDPANRIQTPWVHPQQRRSATAQLMYILYLVLQHRRLPARQSDTRELVDVVPRARMRAGIRARAGGRRATPRPSHGLRARSRGCAPVMAGAVADGHGQAFLWVQELTRDKVLLRARWIEQRVAVAHVF